MIDCSPLIICELVLNKKEAYNKKRLSERQDTGKGKGCLEIDVHKATWHVAARVDGEEFFYVSMESEYHSLRKLLDRFKECRIKVAYEAGPFGFWLYDKHTVDGIEAIVVPPSLIPREAGNRVKTDKKDSRKLARLLESNMLKEVYFFSEEYLATGN